MRTRFEVFDISEAQLPTWFAIWVDANPDDGSVSTRWRGDSQRLEVHRRSPSPKSSSKLLQAIGPGAVQYRAWRTVAHLRRLFTLMHSYIRVAEDIDRSEGGAYSPTARDDAQRARDLLFSLLADIPGEETYRAIQGLALDHPEVEYRAYMRRAARDRATTDSERTWTEQEVRDLVSHLTLPP